MLEMLGLEKHPDKTFIGRIERGFDFLGYHFSRAGLTVAAKTIANFIEKAASRPGPATLPQILFATWVIRAKLTIAILGSARVGCGGGER